MAKGSETSRVSEVGTYRDTIESIWVAIILAFVLRAFVIEAFVIPTGSMAPRLLGDHWDIRCPSCGYEFSFGSALDSTSHKLPQTVASARCPNCRFNYPSNTAQMVNSGDRVLVLKYLYQFSEPQPWDVVVFKNPQDNKQNYIKRLIGLPGECIQIVHGDIFVAPSPSGPWTIRRKGRAQDALWQVIFDNDYRPSADWQSDGNCPRWSPAGGDGWDIAQDDGRVFAFKGGREARQLHFGLGEDGDRNQVLFLPNYGYNSPASLERERSSNNHFINADICTDLRLSCVMRPGASSATVKLMLSAFEFEFEGAVCADGNVSITGKNLPGRGAREFTKTAHVEPLQAGQGYSLALTNVDFQLTLWVNDVPVLQSADSEYGVDFNWIANRMGGGDSGRPEPIPAPRVAIEGQGGAFELWHVKVDRDEFYTQTQQSAPTSDSFRSMLGDYARDVAANAPPGDIRHRRAEPGRAGWGTFGYPIQLAKSATDPDLDEFFVLGDNSPSSLDGRCWILAAPSLRLYEDGKFQYQLGTVPRYNLIGRALFVYWPSGFRVPGLNELPIIPNVGKMRLIR